MTTEEKEQTWRDILNLTDGRCSTGERWQKVMYRLACMYAEQKAALAASEAARERAEQSLKACRNALTRCIYLDDESEDAPADGTIEFLSRNPGLSCTGGMEWRRWADAVRKAFPTADEAATLDATATGDVV
jgi:hypothetical protein